MEQELLQLEQTVAALMEWKKNRVRQRLVYPLDFHSRKAIDKGLFVFTGRTFPFPDIGLAYYFAYDAEVSINGNKRQVIINLPAFPFTANASTDVITSTNGHHNLLNGDRIGVATTSLLPAGLVETTIYYVISQNGTTFKVSTSSGGSAVDITSAGLGTQYYTKL